MEILKYFKKYNTCQEHEEGIPHASGDCLVSK